MNYAGIAANVLAALKSVGQKVLLTHTAPGAYDPATGLGAPTITTTYGWGAMLLLSPRAMTDMEIAGTLVAAEEKHLFLSAAGLSFAPSLGDHITLATSQDFVVSSFITFNPAGVPLYYDLTLQ